MNAIPGIGHNSGRLRFTAPIEEIDPEEQELRRVLEDDKFFELWALKRMGHFASSYSCRRAPVVRANTYGAVNHRQDIYTYGYQWKFPWWCNDPRRPVVMNGALHWLIEKYSWTAPHIAKGYASRVAKRYLRRIKYSCRDREQHKDNMQILREALASKFGYSIDPTGREFYVGLLFNDCPDYLAGEWVDGQHIEYKPTPQIVAKPIAMPARKVVRQIQRKIRVPHIRTTRADERAILRAVYDLGLIKEGDIL